MPGDATTREPAITVERVSKRYALPTGARPGTGTFRDALTDGVRSLFAAKPPPAPTFLALDDVSFALQPGEVTGLVGHNGAGKSTLLKVLSRITEPTSGRVTLRGRVASLLEVGTGFHPELSGRENVFLNGAILGMTRGEIRKRFDEIVAFAGVEQFIDLPVKRFSSGMYVRLAFSVAAHLESDILLVDEVLAVGDAQFQRKSLGRLSEATRDGRTVVFVSHNMPAVRSLCSTAVWMDHGKVMQHGPVAHVVAAYLRAGASQAARRTFPDTAEAPGIDALRLLSLEVTPPDDGDATMDTPLAFNLRVRRTETQRRFHVTVHLANEYGVVVTTTGSPPLGAAPGVHALGFTFPGGWLNSGRYHLKVLFVEDGARVQFSLDQALAFDVHDTRPRTEGWMGREPGTVQPILPWTATLEPPTGDAA